MHTTAFRSNGRQERNVVCPTSPEQSKSVTPGSFVFYQ